jgi:hypothetical protein
MTKKDAAHPAYDHESKDNDKYDSMGGLVQRYDLRDHCQHDLQPNKNQVHSLNVEHWPWQATAQVVAFRKSASTIADEYLQQKDVKLSRSKQKAVKIRDTWAYAQGACDSKNINVRQDRQWRTT